MLIISGFELQGTLQEVVNLRKEVEKLKRSGETDFGVKKMCHSVCEINSSHIVWRFIGTVLRFWMNGELLKMVGEIWDLSTGLDIFLILLITD